MDTPPSDKSSERFLNAWKRLERFLDGAYLQAHSSRDNVDGAGILTWAWRSGILTPESYSFLDRCRQARNAYAHVVFEGYDGPVTLPPTPVVQRLERLVSALTNPPKVTAVSVRSVTCTPDTPVLDALGIMRSRDFSQLPYLHPDLGWLLVTRDQVARWVEASAEKDAACLLDLAQPVSHVTEHPGVGPVIPRIAPSSMLLAAAVEQIAEAFATPDHVHGGYPALLIVGDVSSPAAPGILAADDLPRAYEVLGR